MPSPIGRSFSAIRISSMCRFAKLTAKDYAGWIRSRIAPDKTHPPTFYGYYNYNAEKGGTTHFSVIDRFGNAVACTQSVNTRFGSKLLVPRTGIVLNNEMDDFAIHSGIGNVYGLIGNEANSLQAEKTAAEQHVADDYLATIIGPSWSSAPPAGRASSARPCRRS